MPGTIDVPDTVEALEAACRVMRRRALENAWFYSLPEHFGLLSRLTRARRREAEQKQLQDGSGMSCAAATDAGCAGRKAVGS